MAAAQGAFWASKRAARAHSDAAHGVQHVRRLLRTAAPSSQNEALLISGSLGSPKLGRGPARSVYSVIQFRRIVRGGIGHNLPQEAPEMFADAIIEVDGY